MVRVVAGLPGAGRADGRQREARVGLGEARERAGPVLRVVVVLRVRPVPRLRLLRRRRLRLLGRRRLRLLSPAEAWAANFPNLETLDLDAAKGSEYCPSRFEAIETTMTTCENIRDIDFGQCSVRRELLDFLARSPLGARLTRLSFADALIEDEMLVLAAQRFSHLRDLTMPAETEFDTELFSNLYLARPELTRLDFPSGHMLTDACFKHVCKTFSLHELAIGGPREELTRDFVDAILTSRCSLTLRRVEFDYFEFDVLESRTLGRLVSGCPALADVRWHYDERDKWSDDFIYEEEQDAIADVLASRGGALAILAWNPKKPVIKPFRRYNYY